MKKIFAAVIFSAIISCAAAQPAQDARIVRDCTGTYLRIDGKDYLVCNEADLKGYATNSTIKASYEKISECKESEGKMVCMMYHEYEGLIRVKVKS